MQKLMCTRVLWLGRPAEDAVIKLWEEQVFEATQQVLAEPLKRLKERWPVKQQLEHVKPSTSISTSTSTSISIIKYEY